jgi:hypothetical protein
MPMGNEINTKENQLFDKRSGDSMRGAIDYALEEARIDISASFKENNAVLHSLATT